MAHLPRTLLVVALALAVVLATAATAQERVPDNLNMGDLGGLFGGSSSSAGGGITLPTVQCKVRNCEMCVPGQSIACYKCNEGYRVTETYLCGVKCRVANCRSCTSNIDKCATCNPGYRTTKKGQCTSNVASAAPAPAALWLMAATAVACVVAAVY